MPDNEQEDLVIVGAQPVSRERQLQLLREYVAELEGVNARQQVQVDELLAKVSCTPERIVELEEHIMLLTRRAATARDSVVKLREKTNKLKLTVADLEARLQQADESRDYLVRMQRSRHAGFVEAVRLFSGRAEDRYDRVHAHLIERETAAEIDFHKELVADGLPIGGQSLPGETHPDAGESQAQFDERKQLNEVLARVESTKMVLDEAMPELNQVGGIL